MLFLIAALLRVLLLLVIHHSYLVVVAVVGEEVVYLMMAFPFCFICLIVRMLFIQSLSWHHLDYIGIALHCIAWNDFGYEISKIYWHLHSHEIFWIDLQCLPIRRRKKSIVALVDIGAERIKWKWNAFKLKYFMVCNYDLIEINNYICFDFSTWSFLLSNSFYFTDKIELDV